MALPSARRPVQVQKVLEEEKLGSLKLKFRKADLIMNAVGGWAKTKQSNKRITKNKPKHPLTRKQMERRAVFEAYRLKIPHDKLPKNWLLTVVTRYGLTLYKKKKKVQRKYAYEKGSVNDLSSDSDINSEFDEPKTAETPNIQMTGGRPKRTPKESTVPVKRPKKMIDLTTEPPPGWWLQSFAKGVVLPRKLRVYSDSDQTIIFYDYEVDEKEKDDPALRGYAPVRHNKILKFDWWKEETRKRDEANPSRTNYSSVYFASPEKND